MEQTTISLAGTETKIDPNSIYMVDWSKMQSVNDMVLILASMAIAFPGSHPNIEGIKHLLNLQQPIPQNPQPEAKEIKLPKLKSIKPNGK
jgi:F420-dependent methylenetetrahydromethanopterin dehydrogenase